MRKASRASLEAFFASQKREMDTLERLSGELDASLSSGLLEHADSLVAKIAADGITYQIQCIYTAMESILRDAQVEVDGSAPAGDGRHARLIRQAASSTPARPAMIDDDCFSRMNGLRGFRHLARNNYGVVLDATRIKEVALDAAATIKGFSSSWAAFSKAMLKAASEEEDAAAALDRSAPSSHRPRKAHK